MNKKEADYLVDRIETKAWNAYVRYKFGQFFGFIIGIILFICLIIYIFKNHV